MSYLRGSTYIWQSLDRVHVWVADGDDEWQDSVWAEGLQPTGDSQLPGPGGVSILQADADAYAVMRFAELAVAGQVHVVVEGALRSSRGNVGCEALEASAACLLRAIASVVATGGGAYTTTVPQQSRDERRNDDDAKGT